MAGTSGGLKRFYYVFGALVLAGAVWLWLAARAPGSADEVEAPAISEPIASDGFTGYSKGSADAPVEVVEYSDFQCPYCAQLAVVQFPDIERRLIATGRVRWTFRDFPLEIHSHARLASRAAQCAGEQGRFWEMHDALLWRQREWANLRSVRSKFEAYARELGVDRRAFSDCIQSSKYDGRVQASFEEGRSRGVSGTPTLFVNGTKVNAPPTADELVRIVDSIAPLQ
jgi:protein-disulfide isomerase